MTAPNLTKGQSYYRTGADDAAIQAERILTARACSGVLAPLALRLHQVIETPDGPGTLVQLFRTRAAVSRPTPMRRMVGGKGPHNKGAHVETKTEGRLTFYRPDVLLSLIPGWREEARAHD